jgi:hypothetical protein
MSVTLHELHALQGERDEENAQGVSALTEIPRCLEESQEGTMSSKIQKLAWKNEILQEKNTGFIKYY